MKQTEEVKFLLRKDFREYLDLRRMSAEEFAKKIGYSAEQLSAVINRKIEPSFQMLRKIVLVTRMYHNELIDTVIQPKDKK